eukprot:GHUV01038552.1.p2 GENE.GHUV01038552.1~~GHUV01038552.1.p2  ORF type:complete len:133 (-),score=28.25 GHUV01038552.1:90-488(-)
MLGSIFMQHLQPPLSGSCQPLMAPILSVARAAPRSLQIAVQQLHTASATRSTHPIQVSACILQPNFYQGRMGLSAKKYAECCFVNDWEKFAMAVTCGKVKPIVYSTCVYGRFAGPAWGHVNMFPGTMEWFMQ